MANVDGLDNLFFMSDASVPDGRARVCARARLRYLFDESWMFEFLPDTRM
jgi:hypothetical protein